MLFSTSREQLEEELQNRFPRFLFPLPSNVPLMLGSPLDACDRSDGLNGEHLPRRLLHVPNL